MKLSHSGQIPLGHSVNNDVHRIPDGVTGGLQLWKAGPQTESDCDSRYGVEKKASPQNVNIGHSGGWQDLGARLEPAPECKLLTLWGPASRLGEARLNISVETSARSWGSGNAAPPKSDKTYLKTDTAGHARRTGGNGWSNSTMPPSGNSTMVEFQGSF